MSADTFLRDLVTQLEPNATVVGIEERDGAYRVSVTGTIGVVADCELPRDEVEAAEHGGEARPGFPGTRLDFTAAGRASHGPLRR